MVSGLKTLDELDLTAEQRQMIKEWLGEWALHIHRKIGNLNVVHAKKANFKEWEFFYFTVCNDIIKNDPLFKKPDTEKKVKARKANAYLWLFLKYLLDDKDYLQEGWKRCGHCGLENCQLNGLPYRSGHYNFCPDCGRIQITTYPCKERHKVFKFVHDLWDKWLSDKQLKELKQDASGKEVSKSYS